MTETTKLEVDCRGRKALVEVVGVGPDVVVSGAASPMMWSRPASIALAQHGYRVINFDYGSGSNEPLARTALDQTQDVVDVMDGVGAGRVDVVGLSRGAMTAFGLAAARPGRVTRLVLAFPVAGFRDTIRINSPDPGPESDEDDAAFMRRFLRRIYSSEFISSRMDDAVRLTTMPPGEVTRVDRMEEDPFPDDWTVNCPTLVIEGGADQVVTTEHPGRYLQAVPGAEHQFVPGASHGWLIEEPEEFAGIVAGFLRGDGSRRTAPPGAAGSDRYRRV